MIFDKIKELKSINELIDLGKDDSVTKTNKIKRDQIIEDLEKELKCLEDFDNWKEWKNSTY